MTGGKIGKSLRWNAFLAMVRYELLWNIRKKKFLGMLIVAFMLATLSLFIPVILSNVMNEPLEPNANYVIETGSGLGGFGFLLFAIVTAMNSISGEFESGSIVPLLTKPISRTMVFFGKVVAGFLILLVTYVVLVIYMAVGGTIIYGAQNNLHLFPLYLVGSLLSTFVWISITLALGALSKSSVLAALGTFGVWMGANIITVIVSLVTEQAWILSYVAGGGATGFASDIGSQTPAIPIMGRAIATGTDQIGTNLINYVLYPSADVDFYKGFIGTLVYSESLGVILLRSVLVAAVYICVFSFVAWFAFKRTEIKE
jgi:ABC-type transport system involved in multi-copper enzyme maturation permease subunit